MNKSILIGRVGSDPETKHFDNGGQVCTLTLATSQKYKAKDGTLKEATEWHTVKFNGKLAEIAQKYAKKGDRIGVVGKIHYREAEVSGQKRYYTDILASELELLTSMPKKSDSDGSKSSENENEYDPPF